MDDVTGQLIGGIKACYYGNEDVRATSPYDARKAPDEPGLAEEVKYQRWVLGKFFEKRRKGTAYPNACRSDTA